MIAAILMAVVLIVFCYVSFLVFILTNSRKRDEQPVENMDHITRHGEAQDRGDFYHQK